MTIPPASESGSGTQHPDQAFYARQVFVLIAGMFLIRLIPASLIGLGNDEVYYWTYGLHLQWNYFDHPPLVAIWIRLFTANMFLAGHEVFLRLGSLVSCAAAAWMMYRIGSRLHSPRAGFMMAILYNTSVYGGIIAGIFILPDSPQMLFWTWSLLQLVKLIRNEKSLLNWILFGLASGLCMMSKVHAAFIFIGLFLFVLFYKRTWFRQPGLYLSLLLAALLFMPVVFWNIQNNFITYRYHIARVEPGAFSLHFIGFFRELIGQFLYNNPFNVVLVFMTLVAWNKLQPAAVTKEVLRLFNFIAFPMIGVLLGVALFRDTLPHWSGPAYITLIPLAGIRLAGLPQTVKFPLILKWALGIVLFFMVSAGLLISFLPGTLGNTTKVNSYGQNDFTLDLYGWKDAGIQFKKSTSRAEHAGIMPAGAPVIAMKWFPAAHLDYYICSPMHVPLIGLGELNDLHQYVWLNAWRMKSVDMENAWCIVPTNIPMDPEVEFKNDYRQIRYYSMFAQYRNGKVCRYFRLFTLKGWKGRIPVPELLH